MQFISFAVLGRRIKAIVPMLKDKTVPKRKKALVIFGIAYLLMPFDLIPLIVPVLGIMDDIVLWLYILITLKDELDKYYVEESGEKKASKKYNGKNIIDDVSFEVCDEDMEQTKNDNHGREGEDHGQGTV